MKHKEADRVIPKQFEEVYRCRHHEFSGLTVAETAWVLGIPAEEVVRILTEFQILAPQLFPVLERPEAELWHLYNAEGLGYADVALLLNISEAEVKKRVSRVRKLMGRTTKRSKHREMISWDKLIEENPDAEQQIKESF